MTAPLPPNEAERLQTLRDYNILDTPPEAAFNRITTLAAQIFQAPIALVSLVDADRQWFKACFGVDMRETSRELSFCAYAILSDEVMVVPDTTIDPRFINNGLVTGPPHIRFYAGAPLKTPGGQNLGSLCLLDTVPRQFSTEHQKMLAELAAIVVDELELRHTARELRESEEKFRQFAENINDVFWMVSAEGEFIYTSPAYETIWGRPSAELAANPTAWVKHVHPDDREALLQTIALSAANGGVYQNQFRILRPDSNIRWLKVRAFPISDGEGQVLRVAGVSEDITRLKEAEEALRQAKAATEQLNQVLEERVRERTAELAQSQVEILSRLARAGEYRDDDTGQHTQRVACTASLLAQALGLPPEQVTQIKQAAPLHDVGKIAVSDLILLKPGKLTDEEFDLMKSHASVGAAMLSDGRSEVVQLAERIAVSHHERWDGRGYPQGLVGEAIPIEGRILAVADVFDALTQERPYKKAWPVAEAVAEVQRQSGQQFDPQVVEAFLKLPHDELV